MNALIETVINNEAAHADQNDKFEMIGKSLWEMILIKYSGDLLLKMLTTRSMGERQVEWDDHVHFNTWRTGTQMQKQTDYTTPHFDQLRG